MRKVLLTLFISITMSSLSFPAQADFAFSKYAMFTDMEITYPGVALGDLDDDGDADLVVIGGTGNVYIIENEGSSSTPSFGFAGVSETIDLESYSSVSLADMDGDDDLDMIFGLSDGSLQYLPNSGSKSSYEFDESDLEEDYGDGFSEDAKVHAVAADMDDDDDLDLFITLNNGELMYLENEGDEDEASFDSSSAIQVSYDDSGSNIDLGTLARIAVYDVDDDGDLDLVAGNFEGTVTLYENSGSDSSYAFDSGDTDELGFSDSSDEIDVGSYATVAISDLDGDDLWDLFLGGETNGEINFLPNSGSSSSYSFDESDKDELYNYSEAGSVDIGSFAQIHAKDLDDDDDVDLLLSTMGGEFSYLENKGSSSSASFDPGDLDTLSGDGSTHTNTGGLLFDIDDDDDYDWVAVDGDQIIYYANEGGSSLSFDSSDELGDTLDFAENAISVADMDGDGKIDVLTSDGNELVIYINSGDNEDPEFDSDDKTEIDLDDFDFASDTSAPVAIDIDGDGDQDVLLISDSGETVGLLPNTSTSGGMSFDEDDFQSSLFDISDFSIDEVSSITAMDFNGDDDVDLVIGHGDGTVSFLLTTTVDTTWSTSSSGDDDDDDDDDDDGISEVTSSNAGVDTGAGCSCKLVASNTGNNSLMIWAFFSIAGLLVYRVRKIIGKRHCE
jgi:hypothetical protein